MQILEYFGLAESAQAFWVAQIGGADWSAARLLGELLAGGQLREALGASTRLLLGVEEDSLAAFCTLSGRDEIETDLTPWIGFVYTFPGFRGQRRAGALIERACAYARADGFERVYVSTNAVGLYEQYGFEFLRMDTDVRGGETRVYVRTL